MFRIVAGDFPKSAQFLVDSLLWGSESVNLKGQIESLEIITEENKAKFLSAAGWGLAGLVLAGPAGLLAGALLGGRRKELCVAARLKDGRKFVALVDPQTYYELVDLQT